MSGAGREHKPKRPPAPAPGDDPWARWRTPEAPATPPADRVTAPRAAKEGDAGRAGAVDREKPAKSPPPEQQPAPGKPTAAVRERPTGTLRPLKPAAPARGKPAKTPFAKASTAAAGKTASAAAAPARAPAPPREPGGEPRGVRLSKVMAGRGMCSRREADLWIERGWVFVDGERIAELGSRIDPGADISISREAKQDQARLVTILLNKPAGYVSGQPEPGSTPAVTLISPATQVRQPGDPEFRPWMLRGLAPAGRLDVDSTGLLVLTRDGRVARKLIGEDSDAEKEYLVRVSGELVKDGLGLLNHGLELDGKPLKPARVKRINDDQLHFILREGRKRQIRRMCELVGLRVTGLKRVRIGKVRLGDLAPGHWRFLRADETF
ncbi:MAG: pseudouridine synthase [Dechloromonas sp.]|nr:pseudouridine synthase [Dechloromonas sp.]